MKRLSRSPAKRALERTRRCRIYTCAATAASIRNRRFCRTPDPITEAPVPPKGALAGFKCWAGLPMLHPNTVIGADKPPTDHAMSI